ncbi:two-component sensor histidine kinase [Westiellopsis prolifica IICB1]|nr:two-component sensor histidine kinase [Westiellopsis prolifica IICB1]
MKRIHKFPVWYKLLFSLRTHILFGYVVLMVFSSTVAIITINHVLLFSLEKRIERSLLQEIKEFQQLTRGINPKTNQPFGNDIRSIFKVFLNTNIPSDDEILLTLLNGKIYKSSPRAVPRWLKEDSYLVEYLAQLKTTKQDQFKTNEGIIIYRAEPIIRGRIHGVFVVIQSTASERWEVAEVITIMAKVTFVVAILASLLAWIIAGRVLTPLRLLTETARSISESDLMRRIPVRGSGEIAELTITFNEMLQRLQAAFSSQRDFIDDASHELRTPITIIRGHLELLGDDPQERQETIQLVTDELDRMSRFVNDLLLLAKAERPDFLKLKTVELSLLTEEVYTKAKALAVRDWCLETVANGYISADPQRLTQAITNLVMNATQHTKESDAIALGSAITDNKLRFWVRDTGEGISLSDQKRIFERFARGSSNPRRSDGAGLGLAIVKKIAEAHGGSVELLSRQGNGSTFTIVIPLNPVKKVVV